MQPFLKAQHDLTKKGLRQSLLKQVEEIYDILYLSYRRHGTSVPWKERKAVLMALHFLEQIHKYLSIPEFFWHEQRVKQMFELLIDAKEWLDPYVPSERGVDSTSYFFNLERECIDQVKNFLVHGNLPELQDEIDRVIEDMVSNRQFIINLQVDLLTSEGETNIAPLVDQITAFQLAIIEGLRTGDVQGFLRINLDKYLLLLDKGRAMLAEMEKNPNFKLKFSITPQGQFQRSSGGGEPISTIAPETLYNLLLAVSPAKRKGIKDIMTNTGLAESTVRRHLAKLGEAGYVDLEKGGRFNWYKRTDVGTERLHALSEDRTQHDNNPINKKVLRV